MSIAQQRRLEQFGAGHCVDIHCHCLPGFDDGPASQVESIALCRALVADGITVVVATAHQLGRYDGRNEAEDIRRAVAGLNVVLRAEGIPLLVLPGADVRADERIPQMLDLDRVLTVGDAGTHILIELPHETFIDLSPLITTLSRRGICTILTHPERHEHLIRRPQLVRPWLEQGIVMQITAGSLVGDFGPGPHRAAWQWLAGSRGGNAILVASDAHDAVRRAPRMSAAISALRCELGHPIARRVCIENPLQVVGELSAEASGAGHRG